MSYYSIVCPKCLKRLRNEDLILYFRDELRSAQDQLSVNEIVPAPVPASVDDDFGIITPQQDTGSTTYDSRQSFSIRDVGDEQLFSSLVPEYVRVEVDEANSRQGANDGDLLAGVRYTKAGSYETFINNKRYCPHCGQLLPAQSGKMPTYVLALMGASNAGKTVFITILNRYLGNAAEVVHLTKTGEFRMSAVRTRISSVFDQRSNELFSGRGNLPGVTVGFSQEPYMCQATFRNGDKEKHCLVVLRDMMGEAMNSQELYTHAEICAHASGILMIIDSEAMPGVVQEQLPEDSDSASYEAYLKSADLHQSVVGWMRQELQPKLNSMSQPVPTVVLLSKCDILWKRRASLGLRAFETAILEKLPDLQFDRIYYDKLNTSAKSVMNRFDPYMCQYLSSELFNQPQFMTTSALGYHVLVESDFDEKGNRVRRVTQPKAIMPVRLFDPFIYMLMRVGFLPPLHQMVTNVANLDRRERQQTEQENRAKLSEWARLHW